VPLFEMLRGMNKASLPTQALFWRQWQRPGRRWGLQRRVAVMVVLFPLFLVSRVDATGVSAERWRLVGRGAASNWLVGRLRFFADSICGGNEISSIPWQGRPKGGQRYDGSAFAAPDRRSRGSNADPAVPFLDNTELWDSGRPCALTGDACNIGFHWLNNQVPLGDLDSYGTTSVLGYKNVAPLCLELQQSSTLGNYVTSVEVQYRIGSFGNSTWNHVTNAWRMHTVISGLAGGTNLLRIPMVPWIL